MELQTWLPLITDPNTPAGNSENLSRIGVLHMLPLHPQSHEEIERTIQTAKNILRKNANVYLGLLAYWSVPLRNSNPKGNLNGKKH